MDPRPRAGEPKAQPTVSRVFDDGVLVDLVYDRGRRATAFAVRRADGSLSIEGGWVTPEGERLKPYSPANSLLASDAVLFASGLAPFASRAALLEEVRAFLRRYLDLSPLFEEIAAHYVLLTWVHDAFADLPYLRFRGEYGTGKTRALLTLGHLSYKPFFASGASTVSPLFHILDAFGGTLVLDEADLRFSDATADLTKVLNNGTTRGLPVLRTMVTKDKEFSPRAFKVFGPKLIGMRGAFADPALESRLLTEETGARAPREDVPVQLPAGFRAEALALRNQLLAFRLTHFHDFANLRPTPLPGLEPRSSQMAFALLALVEEPRTAARIVSWLDEREAAVRAERSQTLEAALIEAVLAVFDASPHPSAALGDIVAKVNAARAAERMQPMSPKAVGHLLRQRLHLATEKSRGVYVVPARERGRVDALARRFNIRSAAGPSPP